MQILGVAVLISFGTGLGPMPIIPSIRRIWTGSFVFWSAVRVLMM